MKQICHIVTAEQDLTRLDILLSEIEIYPSRSASAKAIEEDCVFVDGVKRSKSYAVRTGESIYCSIEEELTPSELSPENISLDIRYEDDYLAVISKQTGLICHPSDDHKTGTLVNALLYKYGIENLCNVQGDFDRPGIVHRLDGDTSGLMLIAKDDTCAKALMEDIALKNVDRYYKALVHGIIQPDTGLIDAPIMRSLSDRKKMAVGTGSSSREAITTFKVIDRYAGTSQNDGYTLIECKLYTGRTHQIRVHTQYIGHPIVGDPLYNAKGPKDLASQLGLNRQFLHSYKLSFTHPITEEKLEFEDELAGDLSEALFLLEDRKI